MKKSLLEANIKLANEWHPNKNGVLTPNDVGYMSSKRVWWQCKEDSRHEWEATVINRNYYGSGCPYCNRYRATFDNCLATKNPELAEEWHPNKNGVLTPNDVRYMSNKKVWWICKENLEHEWEASIINRNYNGSGCPYCNRYRATFDNCLATKNPELAEEWHPNKNGDLTPNKIAHMSAKKVWWQCKENPEHEWEATVINRNYYGSGCPYCNRYRAT